MEQPDWLPRLLAGEALDVVPERLIETHASWVLLTPTLAYKFKKPVQLGFLDFSSLQRRQHFCVEELRCNQRFAPDLYLGVVALVAMDSGLRLCAQPPPEARILDYAVQMRRFPPDAELKSQLGQRIAADFAAFGEALAEIHGRLPRTAPGSPYGAPSQVLVAMLDNFTALQRMLARAPTLGQSRDQVPDLHPPAWLPVRAGKSAPSASGPKSLGKRLSALERWTRQRYEELQPLLLQRQQEGWIRECHGDLHLGNLVWLDGRIQAFDCLEFDPALRWVDLISDLAFLLMDCLYLGRKDLGFAVLDAWLAATGDYQGAQLLDFYLVYRAMVRAKVAALRALQLGLPTEAGEQQRQELLAHLALAESWAQAKAPGLVLTCGLSGSGKSWLAGELVSRLPGVRIRSDLERKRLFTPDPASLARAPVAGGIYSPAHSRLLYEHLLRLTQGLLQAGVHCLVDASFLDAAERGRFVRMAESLDVPWVILHTRAPEQVLVQRIRARAAAGTDPSDADLEVLAAQQRRHHGLNLEHPSVFVVDTSQPLTDVQLRGLAFELRRRWLSQLLPHAPVN